MRRSILFLALLLTFAGCGERHEPTAGPAAAPARLTMVLPGAPNGTLAPIYGAQASGDLTRAGIVLSLTGAANGAAALDRLAGGAADLAIASEPDLIAARARGLQLVTIGALVPGPFEALISVAPHAITQLRSLRGATVAVNGSPLQGAELETLLAAAGLPTDGASPLRAADPSGALLRSRASAMLAFSNYAAIGLEQQRRRPTAIGVQSAGVPPYTELSVVVRQAEARSRGPLLRTLMQALARGAQAVRRDSAPALGALLASVPGLDRKLEAAALQRTATLLPNPSPATPYGFQDPRGWQRFAIWMAAHRLASGDPTRAPLAVTNEFLPGEGE
ncbi:MAG: hypothetical protein NVSMB51_19150 [Solirubrobacteraceae bacterium]